jgi:hypothetical protein
MYDIIFLGNKDETFYKLKSKFPMIKNAESFDLAKKKALTKFFWIIWPDTILSDTFNFDYVPDQWSNNYVHIFKNGSYYDGIVLVPKKIEVTQKEIDYRFFRDKKEVDIVASTPAPYEIFRLNSYEEYLNAIETSTTDMFWVVWNDIEVKQDFKFDYYIPVYDSFHRQITHVFKNGEYYDGIVLCSKHSLISEREFKYRFITNKKEHDTVASDPCAYDKIIVNTYEEFCELRLKVSTDFFYVIPNDVEVKWDFNYHIPYYERDNIHVFKNGKYHDGVFLIHKNKTLAQREFDYKFFVNKKEIDITVSTPKPYDIVFISYNEPNADDNYSMLAQRFSRVKRIHGVKGIHQAHIKAAELCTSTMFWVVDGDAQLLETFKFNYQTPKWQQDQVFVWRSINPINDLEYGYGGVKLLPRTLTLNMDLTKPDMTTSISDKFKAVEEVSNISAFNTDEFSTWRSAFRECCKLASKTIKGQIDEETDERLARWCSAYGRDRLFGDYSISGARAGRKYGNDNFNKPDKLVLINDFDWLKEQFDATRD